MHCQELVYSGHALRRMFERGIGAGDVRSVVESGEIIAEYPEETPYPASLILGFVGGTALHVVVAEDRSSSRCVVVTVYVPDPRVWDTDFKTRKAG